MQYCKLTQKRPVFGGMCTKEIEKFMKLCMYNCAVTKGEGYGTYGGVSILGVCKRIKG